MDNPSDMLIDIPMNKAEAETMERAGFRVTDKRPASVISGHLRDELIRILQAGDDKNGGAFTIAVATQIEKFSIAAREILMTEKMAENDLGSLMRMRKRPPPGVPYLGSSLASYGGWNDITGSMGVIGNDPEYPMPMPINNENFGVQAIRQVVDAFRTMGESPAKLVEALAVARTNNMPDVVAALEKKLGIATTGEMQPKPQEGDPT